MCVHCVNCVLANLKPEFIINDFEFSTTHCHNTDICRWIFKQKIVCDAEKLLAVFVCVFALVIVRSMVLLASITQIISHSQ